MDASRFTVAERDGRVNGTLVLAARRRRATEGHTPSLPPSDAYQLTAVARPADRTQAVCERLTLDDAIARARSRRIAIVHGPAGCGKTTALDRAFAGNVDPLVRFDVRFEHGSIERFVPAFVVALGACEPALTRTFSAGFANFARKARPWDNVASWLATTFVTPLTIAVDHIDRIAPNDEIGAFIARLVDHAPKHVRWIFSTRTTDALPLAGWLASGEADVSVGPLAFDDGVLADERLVDFGWTVCDARPAELVALATLPSLAADVVAHLPQATRALLGDLASETRGAIIASETGDSIALSDALRERAHVVAANDRAARGCGRRIAARALERAGRVAEALATYALAEQGSDVLRLLDEHGFDLAEGGRVDAVLLAIEALTPGDQARSAIALMFRAIDASYRGRHDVSESWFTHAIALATSDDQRLRVEIAYAVDLLRRGRPDVIERLQRLERIATDDAHALVVIASLAAAFASRGRLEEASVRVATSLALLERVADVGVRARVHQRIAFVELARGAAEAADHHANLATKLARELADDELVAIARTTTYVVATSYRDDQTSALAALRDVEQAGKRTGNQLCVRFALLGRYLIEAERGDAEALRALDRGFAVDEIEASSQQVEEGLVPARALRYCWNGEFARAYQSLAPTIDDRMTTDERALRSAEVATYAAAAGLRARGVAHARESLRALRTLRADAGLENVEILKATLFAALALHMLGRRRGSRLLLGTCTAARARWPRWSSLFDVIDRLVDGEESDLESILDAFERMRASGLGGVARMVERLPEVCSRGALADFT